MAWRNLAPGTDQCGVQDQSKGS